MRFWRCCGTRSSGRRWAGRARVSAVVEETLRYDPPVQLMGRIAADDMTIGDTTVVKGDTMMLLLAAAQHDPAAFDRPGEFDPDRESIRHLGFGKGPHFCLGAPLARLEAAVALSAVTARFPHARMDGEPQYKQNLTLRGMSTLSVIGLEFHFRQDAGRRHAHQSRSRIL